MKVVLLLSGNERLKIKVTRYIKFSCATAYPTFSEITEFRNQYTITKNLDIPGIIKPYSLEKYRNGYALVMEDFSGVTLSDYMNFGGKHETIRELTIPEFLQIAIQLSTIISDLHRNRVIHKDIKPANILIDPITFEVKLIDFSIASLLPREVQFLTSPSILEGTLAYISPEQTGRMNRGIDYRSDFYSLGVTFFELLTNQLPFATTDLMELVYSHLAKQPPTASYINPNIPSIISDITSKLMAKNAEDRYQSALGLKFDLELCKQQWEQAGKITPFELGKQDIPDRFLIPEKLYGRKHEVETLLAAFERVTQGTTEMILVVGASGIGKTAVVNEVHKPIARQRSYFIKGKFDQLGRDIPLSGFVQAFEDLIGQLLSETDAQIEYWKGKILSALGTQGQVIIDLIPRLELIIGKQPPSEDLSGNAAQNRFNLLFQRFIQVFATKDCPLVIFLDDLQWADAASLKFMQLLMSESHALRSNGLLSKETNGQGEDKRGFLLIGAYRDNEVSESHPLHLTLNEIRKIVTVNTILIEALNKDDLNLLIADTLRCPESVALSFTKLIYAKTKGNPFFIHQFLKYLNNQEVIKFNFDLCYWECNISKLQISSLTDDVVKLMAIQIEKLPIYTQEILKICACLGNEFDLKSLAVVCQKSEVDTAADLWPALAEGLILPEAEVFKLFQDSNELWLTVDGQSSITTSLESPQYKFVHDRVQQAAYSLIPESQKQTIHLKIGQRLLLSAPIEEQEENIFEIVNQLNIAEQLITNQTERNELVRMNLIAGCKAKVSTAYAAAVKYLTTGIKLLASDSWETNYDQTLTLYETTAEVTYLAGDFEQIEQFVKVMLVKAKTPLDQVKAYEVKIQAYGAQNKALEAVNTALSFLKSLDVEFPTNPNQLDVHREMEITASNLANTQIKDLINLPKMTEAQPLAVMGILSSTIVFAYQAVPELFSLIVLKQINLSIKHGNAPLSAFAYVAYGLILCGMVGDIESGYQFGKVAESLLSKYQTKDVTAKVLETFNQFIRPWKEHIKETLRPLLEVYSIGLETGDLEFAGYALYCYSLHTYFIGQELKELELEMRSRSSVLQTIKQERMFYWNEIYRQTALNLLGGVDDPYCLIGEAYNEYEMVPLHLESKDAIALFYLYLCKMQLCYTFSNHPQALENAVMVEKYFHGGIGGAVIPQFHFYDSLIRLALYPNVEEFEQKQILKKISVNQEKMHQWAHHAPMNYFHKFYLVEAEQNRILGNNIEAMELYDRAIAGAKEHDYIPDEALGNELAAKFYLEWGKQKIAQTYLTDAYYGYLRWGALAKVNDLIKGYSQLLSHVFQQEKISPHSGQKGTYSNNISPKDRESLTGSSINISDILDLASVVKASQALSGQIELELLLSTLMEVVMENAGASKCALILNDNDNSKLTVKAISSSSNIGTITTELPSIALELNSDIPVALINYVKRTQDILVVDNTAAIDPKIAALYNLAQGTKSILCIPILKQSKLIGILYLENNLTTAAFTRDRVEVLKLITTQAAICLENAILYYNLEEKVKQRTQELNEKSQSLEQALQNLQSTQAQLIQSEKMSSLGQMVAGIAHEINNPLNFIEGNITHASQYIQDLLDLIAVYQQECPNLSPSIQRKIIEIDMDFVQEDLPKLLHSMHMGSSRIRNIVLGLRNFSRLDEAEMKPVDIHEGIDNTLMILQHRLQGNSNHVEIKVIKQYGNLPQVNCYPSQLNQVFMNVLSNAIDAVEEMEKNNHSLDYNPEISIRTEVVDSNTVTIKIGDNGPGISSQIQEKIFDPFFTTKPVGSGTGLGLSVSYQIIVEKHKGRFICSSVLGQGAEFIIEIPM
ncbi:AAA family ATPase [Aetokthonos hydrillicola Thurmond2011]|uniref:histidine kinase n=1 Tax=Aetokthonos hydrillicola Thurmond2011 TaxID=2712845 RepID=A0AAP5I8D7_9CYAN|nr:AAA family ATPase [Aetokthonos hydrillicola]MDR9896579.1 AAA family ATPase [Aetokthonos hydrillicola Thurmond2011]